MTNLDSILKSTDITLPTKVYLVKAMVFPVVIYGCESWTVKKGECGRIDAFEVWCWRRLFRVPWTARRSNQSILKEISPGISLEGMMLKLKLQYFGHLMRRGHSLEETDAGRDCGQEEKGTTEDEMAGWHHWLDGHEFEWTLGVGDGQGGLGVLWFMGSQRVEQDWVNWTELNWREHWERGGRKGQSLWFVFFLSLHCEFSKCIVCSQAIGSVWFRAFSPLSPCCLGLSDIPWNVGRWE